MKTKTNQSIIALIAAAALAVPFALAANEPQNVSNVQATGTDETSITVTWDDALDYQGNPVDHYRLYYGPQSVQGGQASTYEVTVDTPDNTPSYSLNGLTTDKTYYVSVTAIDASDVESLEYSIETSATPTSAVEAEAGDTVAPTVLNVIAADSTHVLVGFSEPIKLPELLPEAAFTITEQINPANVLDVVSATQYADDPDGKTVVLETAPQTANVNYIVTASVAILDMAGNPISSGNADSGLFLGSELTTSIVSGGSPEATPAETTEEVMPVLTEETAAEEVDVTPPEDITDLILTFKEELEKFIVVMNWTASLNTAKDLVDQIVYQSLDRGVTYDTGTSLGPVATNHEVPNLEGGKEYTFKVTTKDAAGNESVGVVKSIRLPQTGFGAGFLIIGSALAAGRMLKRRKSKGTM